MTQEEFFGRIRSSPPDILAGEFFCADSAHIFPDQVAYNAFRERISSLISSIESVSVVGSGNWRYSLNPEKGFREFGEHSDVDVAIISSTQFRELWEEMRQSHRKHFYALSYSSKQWLRRNSENVYSGFISPDWIPNRSARRAFEYKQMLNLLSDHAVRFLKVKMMFFKNFEEMVDYYARGFRAARRTLQ
jgi:hypothetical protein